MTSTQLQDTAPLAPHPVLDEYYGDETQRRGRVDEMFNASARHYEWVNRVMSFGSGDWYRKQALQRSGLAPGMRLLDVGSGTGAVARMGQSIVGSAGRVVALDPSRGMLTEARAQGVQRMTQGLGEALPFPDASFDMLSMGYALRHVRDLRAAFLEYKRVLRPGARVLLLEITAPKGRVSLAGLRFYMRTVLPGAVRVLRRSEDAQELMRYYWDTIETCVRPEAIMTALEEAGFQSVKRHRVMGIFSEYSGVNE